MITQARGLPVKETRRKQEVPGHKLRCDCGSACALRYPEGEGMIYRTTASLVEWARRDGWTTVNGKHYAPGHAP